MANRRIRTRTRLIAPLSVWLVLGGISHASGARASTCSQAAQSAELRNGMPAGLLTAVGHVESGGWGWSVNGNNGLPGRHFATAGDALAYTEDLLGSGIRTIDVGCFQVDLRYHPEAFQRWQDGFDQDANADAAARILTRLHAQTGDWSRAIALYHSGDPQRGELYLQAVMNAWDGPARASAAVQSSVFEVAVRTLPVPVAVWGPGTWRRDASYSPMRSSRLPKIITP